MTDFVVGHCSLINPYTVAIDPQEILKHIKLPKKTKAVTGCPLCSNIWSSAESYKKFANDSDAYYKTVIVVWDDKPWLYTMCDDWYLMQINLCPKCGRRLMKE